MSSLSTLVDSIKFQLLVKQLDDDEFDTFLSQLWRRNGRDTVLQLLRPNKEHNDIPQKELIQITSTIITERDPSHRNLQPTSNSISGTPSHLIGEIASFLHCRSYVSFSSTNRKMFVDCNSPNRFTKLELSEFNQIHPSFSLSNYPKLRYLDLNLIQIAAMNMYYDAITRYCPKLQTLCIGGTQHLSEMHIANVMSDDAGCCGSITTLKLYNFRGMAWDESILKCQQLVRLLNGFNGLTHLDLRNMYYDYSRDHCDIDQFKSLCPRIREISMNCVYGLPYAVLLAAFGYKLLSLTLDQCFRSSLQFPPNSDWSKLQRLSVTVPTKNSLDAVLNTATNIKSISFIPKMGRNVRLSDDEIENALENVIIDHSSLQRFSVSTAAECRLEEICNSIHRGLIRIHKKRKEHLEIALYIDCMESAVTKEFVSLASKILLTLSKSKIEVWKLILEPHGDYSHIEPMIQVMESFIAEHGGKGIKLLDDGSERLVIGN